MLSNIKSSFAVWFNLPTLYGNLSFSQYGEDLVAWKMFKSKRNGFYIDIGAHHPFRYSNTQLLYVNGWEGINIDPSPKVKQMFDRVRNRDNNLAIAVGKKINGGTFYLFSDSAFNTLNKEIAEKVNASGQSRLIGTQKIAINTLNAIFTKYAKHKQIDFLNIDTEGTELEILQSNNWKRFKPQVICIENFRNKSAISEFLSQKGYKLEKQVGLSGIYILL